ncbi:MAG: mechanosensitive ion channel family protein [Leptolyngbyaceae cyanobacterium SM2_3_12]|nr:mechanosensitive ion channel family protein [Leptolyngbyaceae cyanobacterium SM2_3_12]
MGEDLQTDAQWQNLILDDPQISGVDDFGDSAIIIRVWIKTHPMQQWDISREYRRRFIFPNSNRRHSQDYTFIKRFILF